MAFGSRLVDVGASAILAKSGQQWLASPRPVRRGRGIDARTRRVQKVFLLGRRQQQAKGNGYAFKATMLGGSTTLCFGRPLTPADGP